MFILCIVENKPLFIVFTEYLPYVLYFLRLRQRTFQSFQYNFLESIKIVSIWQEFLQLIEIGAEVLRVSVLLCTCDFGDVVYSVYVHHKSNSGSACRITP